LLDYPCELSEAEFKKPERRAEGGRFLVRDETIKFEYFANIEAELALFDYQNHLTQVQLVSWLERNIPDESILPDEKAAYLNRAITWLIENRGLVLDELTYSRFRLRLALESRIKDVKRQAMRKIHQLLLTYPENFVVDNQNVLTFKEGYYAYDRLYVGFRELPKHFFPQIGNLGADGEEFECAAFLATGLEELKYWVRNVDRKLTSFSLQTSTDRFYPDFVCLLEDGRILVVEYKNSRDWDLPDNKEKRQLGELWEKRSNGNGLFIMPRGKDWEAIRSKMRSHAT
jgi:type III restriction enzyme